MKKEYEKLPLIHAYVDQLDQVFFNLLCNAINAINEKLNKNIYQNQIPQIFTATQLLNKNVVIRIKDNGIGIPEAYKNRHLSLASPPNWQVRGWV
ncbi:ATP-binding protein [Leptothermofonsia sp. ETS-13]|uniref:ATP-binding protein n=1 Tax=Leptothermofonsia sp. ETS-13 TaxID=3035696 RepID=UPI003BA25021